MKKVIAGIILALFAFTLVAPVVEAKTKSKVYRKAYTTKKGKHVKAGHTHVHKKH